MGHRCAAKWCADVLSPQVSRQLDHVGWSLLGRALPTALWETSPQAAPSGSKDNNLPSSSEGGRQHLDNVPQLITARKSVCLMCPQSTEHRPGGARAGARRAGGRSWWPQHQMAALNLSHSTYVQEPYYLWSKLVHFFLLKSTLMYYHLHSIKCIYFKYTVL